MKQSSFLSGCFVVLVGVIGCSCVILTEPRDMTNTNSESTQSEVTSTSDCTVGTGQKITGNGTKELEDKTFYYFDYQNSETDAKTHACIYAKESSQDYYLEYEEDFPGNRIGISFVNDTTEKGFENGEVLGN